SANVDQLWRCFGLADRRHVRTGKPSFRSDSVNPRRAQGLHRAWGHDHGVIGRLHATPQARRRRDQRQEAELTTNYDTKLAPTLIESARMAVLKTNATTPWIKLTRRMARETVLTSPVCAAQPI